MNHKEQLNRSFRLATLCVLTALIAVGCGQQADQGGVASTSSTASSSTAASNDAAYSRFTPIKPDMTQASAFKYKIYEFANDGSWISIVPMPPKSGDLVVAVNVSGSYDVKLTNEKCASAVNVSPSVGSSFVLTNVNPNHKISIDKGTHLKVAMSDAAPNNYFCNVAVAATAE